MEINNKSSICIIGGGIAGLSAANYLVDQGISPVLVEAQDFGRHKVCGEFYSPEATSILNRWEVPFVNINQAYFINNSKTFNFKFLKPAASVSRVTCEKTLADRAQSKKAQILTQTQVVEIIPPLNNHNNFYKIKLSNGETIQADSLIIAAGRLPFFSTNTNGLNPPKYIGIKAHFKNLPVEDKLFMYLFKGAYMGITSIEDEKTNISCLAKREVVEQAGGAHVFIQNIIENSSELKNKVNNAKCLYDNWLVCPIYSFCKKTTVNWPNSYFIGDAAATIAPASGNGLAMALTSGIMAADHAMKSTKNFKKSWNSRYSNRLYWAKMLHYLFMRPNLSSKAFYIAEKFPALAYKFYQNTRET